MTTATIGIIGGGQLGQMLGYAGAALDVECLFLEPNPDAPASTAGELLPYGYDDPQGLDLLAQRARTVTYEFENVPVDSVVRIAHEVNVFPTAEALQAAQDRLHEKRLFRELGIPTPEFHAVDSQATLERAAEALGFPFVLKTRRLGYDGKGQVVIRNAPDMGPAWENLGGVALLAEAWIAFDIEVSMIGARNTRGNTAFYPLTQNAHKDGILRTSRAPAGDTILTALASDYHSKLTARLDYVGVLALELFVVGDQLIANEIAPRVHNSGHWTIEGTPSSQFENHLRAVSGMPLGETGALGFAAMENLIGTLPGNLEEIRKRGFYVHDYGKAPRPGRKLGHITLVAESEAEREEKLAELGHYLYA